MPRTLPAFLPVRAPHDMLLWLVALGGGIAAALLQHGWRGAAGSGRAGLWPALAALRAAGITGVIALLVNAQAGPARPLRPVVALDASASWRRAVGADSSAWLSARRRALAVGAESVWTFGDSVRPASGVVLPGDGASRVGPAVERALAAGRPALIVTDGELDDPAALADLPGGSRVEVDSLPRQADLAVASLDAPRASVGGDTIAAHVTVTAGARPPVARGRVVLLLDGREVQSVPLEPLTPRADRLTDFRLRVPDAEGTHLLAAVVAVPGDAEPRNDTLGRALEVSRSAGVMVVSTAPDEDLRYALAVMRGALALPVRAALRIAPGQWRAEGTLAPLTEAEVRDEARRAPLLVLHGDTAVFGPPDSVTRSALVLVPGALPQPGGGAGAEDDAVGRPSEWFATAAPPSPVASALAGIVWDSLPPLDAGGIPAGEWSAIEIRRARQFDARPAVAGRAQPRRRVIVATSGMWRWAFRGGASAEAFTAFWGSILDWVAVERGDARAAMPADGVLHAGDAVRWRRAPGARAGDSSVSVVLTRRGRPSRVDSMTLTFAGGATVAESAPLPPGIWDAAVAGGRSTVVVNASREWLPRAVTVRSGPVGSGAALDTAPRVRGLGWMYLVVAAALCGEWVLRRRAGLR